MLFILFMLFILYSLHRFYLMEKKRVIEGEPLYLNYTLFLYKKNILSRLRAGTLL